MTYNPNVYILGGKPRLILTTTDIDGHNITPSLLRLSVKRPDGVIVTYSGGDMTVASGYMYYRYSPPTIGWYEYEGWVADGSGNEDADTRGFEVVDRVY